jgi:dTDP-4-dehydrorhamnose reductase
MRIVITGGKGQLGRALRIALVDHDLTIIDLPEVDITIGSAIDQVMTETEPEIVIHCAAFTNVDGCALNPEMAFRVNGLGTQNVALACERSGSELLHISTNEVFRGDRTSGYEEWMPLDPINPYGHSKAAAEKMVTNISSRYYIVRTAWLYAAGGRNFIHAILDKAKSSGNLRVVANEVGNPTYAKDLAMAISELVATKQYGTYHFTNSGYCSRWSFANEILRVAGLQDVVNTPILARDYKRLSTPPPYGVLHNISGAAIGISLRTWQEALAEYMSENGLGQDKSKNS